VTSRGWSFGVEARWARAKCARKGRLSWPLAATPSAEQVPLAPGTWKVDPSHTTLEFAARYLMVTKVRGLFREFLGAIMVGATPEQSAAHATIQAASGYPGTRTRGPPAIGRFLRRREIPDPRVPKPKRHTHRRFSLGRTGRPHDSRGHQAGNSRRAVPRCHIQRSLGRAASWLLGDGYGRPRGLRSVVEPSARNRWGRTRQGIWLELEVEAIRS
jgi:hypothetical protein